MFLSLTHLSNLPLDIPLSEAVANPEGLRARSATSEASSLTVFVCRLGNDSQIAADAVRQLKGSQTSTGEIVDLVGGLRSWANDVDSQFPVY